MPRVVHFEIQAGDLDRAKSFYANAFGWTFEDFSHVVDSPYWGVSTGASEEPGIDGGLLLRPLPPPESGQGTNAFVCTINVEDYDSAHERILAAGGIVAMPKYPLPGMAWQGYYLDSEGNTFGIHHADPEAR